MTAADFADGSTITPKNGGAVVATPSFGADVAIIRDCGALLGLYVYESVVTRLSAPALVSRASIAFRRTPFDEQS